MKNKNQILNKIKIMEYTFFVLLVLETSDQKSESFFLLENTMSSK